MPTITPLEFSFGAVVTDIALAHMNENEWYAVEDAFHEFAALVAEPRPARSEHRGAAFWKGRARAI